MVDYDATGPQKRAIAKLYQSLGVSEPIEEKQMTSGEAGCLVRSLYSRARSSKRALVLETTSRVEALNRLDSIRGLGFGATLKYLKSKGIYKVYKVYLKGR